VWEKIKLFLKLLVTDKAAIKKNEGYTTCCVFLVSNIPPAHIHSSEGLDNYLAFSQGVIT
jgi:hypothetical protein